MWEARSRLRYIHIYTHNAIVKTMANPKLSRNKTLAIIEKENAENLKKIRSQREYQMPEKYISWRTLTNLIAWGFEVFDENLKKMDIATYIHLHNLLLWFAQDAPLYCLSQELLEAFEQTDVLEHPAVLRDWTPSLPILLVALPTGVQSSEGELDYILISVINQNHPDWGTGKLGLLNIPKLPTQHPTQVYWATCDKFGTVWFTGTGVDGDQLYYSERADLGRSLVSSKDQIFLSRMRNLVLNILLALQYNPGLIAEISEKEIATKARGFSLPKAHTTIRRPRWLGKGYCRKSATQGNEGNSGTHASPRGHSSSWALANTRSWGRETLEAAKTSLD